MLGCKLNLRSISYFYSINSIIIGISFLFICSICNNVLANNANTNDNTESLTAIAYIKILRLRRKEHTSFVQNMLKSDYSRNFKIISMGLEKILHVRIMNDFLVKDTEIGYLQIFNESNQTLTQHDYSPNHGFPIELKQQEAVISILENCCLAADIILHFPEISYRVLKKIPGWRDTVNWCIGFVNSFPQITDERIVELMDLVRQEINEKERSNNFINPYYTKVDYVGAEVKQKRKQKKLKKGPALTKQEL